MKFTRFILPFIGRAVDYARSVNPQQTIPPEKQEVVDLLKEIKSENEMLLIDYEAHQIFFAVRGTEQINGDIAEVGVYRGWSAKIICEAKSSKALHLFDTFEGLQDLHNIDNPVQFHKRQYLATLEDVKNYLCPPGCGPLRIDVRVSEVFLP